MRTYKKDGVILNLLLDKQTKIKSNNKIFIATLSYRQVGLNNTLKFIENLISKIDEVRIFNNYTSYFSQGKLTWLREYKVSYNKNKIKLFKIYTYSDKQGPMITFKIKY